MVILSLVASAWILASYAAFAHTANERRRWWFNLANALGCIPVIVTEMVAGTWAALALTAGFGLVGLYGLLRSWSAVSRRRAPPHGAAPPDVEEWDEPAWLGNPEDFGCCWEHG